MTTTTPKLTINPTLPVLAFNFEQLKAWATGIAEQYSGIVVTEDAIPAVKQDMADINKAKKAIDDARKEAVRRVSEPIRTFETQIKEVCGIFDSVYAGLAEQVKRFEDAQREEKRKNVEGLIIEANLNAFGEPAFLDIPVQEKWLNKTTSIKSIRDDLAAIVERHMEEEQRRKALEQARKDRAIAIENHVRALNEKYGLNMPVANFLGSAGCADSSRPLQDTFAGIEAVFAAEAKKNAQREQQAAKDAAPAMQSASTGAAVKPSPQPQNAGLSSADPLGKAEAPAQAAPTGEKRAMSIVLEYDVHNEAQIKAIITTLKPLCVNFGARYR